MKDQVTCKMKKKKEEHKVSLFLKSYKPHKHFPHNLFFVD